MGRVLAGGRRQTDGQHGQTAEDDNDRTDDRQTKDTAEDDTEPHHAILFKVDVMPHVSARAMCACVCRRRGGGMGFEDRFITKAVDLRFQLGRAQRNLAAAG